MDCTGRRGFFALFRDNDAFKISIIDFLAQSGRRNDSRTAVPPLCHHLVLDYF